jgi:cytochrome b subunit of formate dehydrogenase
LKVKFDFVIHWLWTIVFSLLALSGLAMVGAKYGWILQYDIEKADYIHRSSYSSFCNVNVYIHCKRSL